MTNVSPLDNDSRTPDPSNRKISVLIACYNVEKWVRPCIDSILAQRGNFTLEVIAVDDCSTDNTHAILRSYEDERVRVIRHERNMGLSCTRNTGLDNMTGDFFYLLDGDDYLPEGALELLNQSFDDDVDWVQGGYTLVDEAGNEIAKLNHPDGVYCSHQDIANQFDDIEFTTATNRLVSNRFKDIRFPVGISPAEDVMWNLQAFPRVTKIVNVNATTYQYIQHPSSTVHTTLGHKRWINGLLYCIPLMQKMLNEGWSRKAFCSTLLQAEGMLYIPHTDVDIEYRQKVRKELKTYHSSMGDLSTFPYYIRIRHALFASSLPDVTVLLMYRFQRFTIKRISQFIHKAKQLIQH